MKQTLYRWTCDECGIEMFSETAPDNWIRVVSTESRNGSNLSLTTSRHPARVQIMGRRNGLSRVNHEITMPDHGYWCSLGCLTDYLTSKIQREMERA